MARRERLRTCLAAWPLVSVTSFSGDTLDEKQSQDIPLVMWYAKPADPDHWNEALPIGNGHLGGMVFGGVGGEHIQMNQDTIWNGHRKDRKNLRQARHSCYPRVALCRQGGRSAEAGFRIDGGEST
jgi:hypothetical protein